MSESRFFKTEFDLELGMVYLSVYGDSGDSRIPVFVRVALPKVSAYWVMRSLAAGLRTLSDIRWCGGITAFAYCIVNAVDDEARLVFLREMLKCCIKNPQEEDVRQVQEVITASGVFAEPLTADMMHRWWRPLEVAEVADRPDGYLDPDVLMWPVREPTAAAREAFGLIDEQLSENEEALLFRALCAQTPEGAFGYLSILDSLFFWPRQDGAIARVCEVLNRYPEYVEVVRMWDAR